MLLSRIFNRSFTSSSNGMRNLKKRLFYEICPPLTRDWTKEQHENVYHHSPMKQDLYRMEHDLIYREKVISSLERKYDSWLGGRKGFTED